MNRQREITAVILAGGRGSRMGGVDKGLLEFKGKSLIEHIISVIEPQVGSLMINANRNHQIYSKLGYPVVADSLNDYQGPLAGFLAAMQAVQTPYIVTLPCDGPMLTDDLVARLVTAREREQAEIAVAFDGKRLQPVYALIPISLEQSLQSYLDGGDRKIDLWYAQHQMAKADFSDIPNTFTNVNTPEEQQRLQRGDVA
jgi:molybdenum cofactor guanylyltransferase